jgi:hypothetical protein
VSPGGQTISVSVEGVPPSTIPDVVCPPAKGVSDPAVLVPDASQLPLTNPDSAASADRNLEVLIGLSEFEYSYSSSLGSCRKRALYLFSSHFWFWVPVTGNPIRLDRTPPPGIQPRLIAHQESISGFSPAGDTGSGSFSGLPPAGGTRYDGVAATSSPRGPLPVPPLLFSEGKEAGCHPQILFPVRRPDTG